MITQDAPEGEQQEDLILRNNGKIVYAVAYENPYPQMRYLLATDRNDALRQVIKSRRSLGKIVGISPAIGVLTNKVERKRIYCFGPNI